MSRGSRPTDPIPGRNKSAGVDQKSTGEASIVHVAGLVDEHFAGFGVAAGQKVLVIDVSAMTRMTSFGVRQWLKAMDALPKSITDLYLLGGPTFFVDQLNMVLNFGGTGKVLTVVAPYTCPSCGAESGEQVDVLAERATLAKGGVPEKDCQKCGGKLEFDETPESYFSFVGKYAASSIHPAAAQLLSSLGLYTAVDTAGEKPPRIIKLVHGPVTYFRIIGTIGSMFRARPFLVGAEGEVVLDLAEVDRYDSLGQREWTRLMKSLSTQVPSITLVDVSESFMQFAGPSVTSAKNIYVWSVHVPYACTDCGRNTMESHALQGEWPIRLPDQVCSTCGGTTRSTLRPESLAPLQKASIGAPQPSAKLIQNRQEVLSRALTDASVAQAGEGASAQLGSDDTILGKYKIVRRLSSGGMAEVFLAKQVGIGGFEKPVALKRILRQLLESRHLAVDMFLNEAKIAGRLAHPNIVQVLDVAEEQGALFLAMEYVHGRDLRDLLKKLRDLRTTMPLGDTCYIIREVAAALHHAYWSVDLSGNQLSVVHRDVSPHNVILGYDGTVKLLDFGVAMSSVTEQSGATIAGKWAYMSPEHTTNQQIDHRSDLFSVGVMFYLMCTGNMPFGGTEPKEIVKKIRAGTYKPLDEVAPHLPPDISHLVRRMLAPNPEDRPQTGQEVVATLNDIMRTYALDGSGSTISQLLAQHLPQETAAIKEILGKGEDWDVQATKKLAVGSGSTQTQADPRDGTATQGGMRTPSGPWGVDHSVSLARRSSDHISTKATEQQAAQAAAPTAAQQPAHPSKPAVQLAPPAAPKPGGGNSMRIVLVAVLVVAAAVAMYILVRPT
ncbi:MAG: serine/threonine-protein kinase [Kofleriaceae bacterium]|nr:serine/threonine-protein kinase [Kofleriaceae bacterium]